MCHLPLVQPLEVSLAEENVSFFLSGSLTIDFTRMEQIDPSGVDIQVGRRQDPLEDAAAVVAIRAAVGPGLKLRADANRLWTLEQALQFALAAESADLEVCRYTVASSCSAPYYKPTALSISNHFSVVSEVFGPLADQAMGLVGSTGVSGQGQGYRVLEF